MTSLLLKSTKSDRNVHRMVTNATTPPNNFHLNNILDKDLQSVLKPLNLMQANFICSKYTIRDDRIQPNSVIYNLIGVVCMLILRVIILYRLIIRPLFETKTGLGLYLYFNSVEDTLFHSVGFIMNNYINIRHSNNNILLVMNIQFALRVFNIKEDNLKSLIINNWVCVCCLYGTFVFYIIYIWIDYPIVNIVGVISAFATLAFDINIVYAFRLITLLEHALKMWILEVQELGNAGRYSDIESYWSTLYDAHQHILEAYKIIEKLFEVMFVFYVSNTAFHSMLNIMGILTIKHVVRSGGTKYIVRTLMTQVWILKNVILIIYLSVQCERFSSTVQDVYSTCVLLLKSPNCADAQKRVCKNIKRVQKTSFSKMSACRLFHIDANLSVGLSGFIINYIIVLLGFAFL